VIGVLVIETINRTVFLWINGPAGNNPALDYIAVFFAEAGPYILMALLILLWFLTGKDRRNDLLLTTEAAVVGVLLNFAIALFYFHPRPFMIGIGHLLLYHAPETSFPSDHATVLLSAALYLLIFSRWISIGAILLLISFLTAWGRVYCGVHFPFDMVGSLGVSFTASFIIYSIMPLLNLLNGKVMKIYDIIIERFIP
jgi:undecaprenyl-diphosphatase